MKPTTTTQFDENSLFTGQAHFIGSIERNEKLYDYYELSYDGTTSFVYVPRSTLKGDNDDHNGE